MTVFKIKNLTASKQPLHTVEGVRNIGPRRTREFDLSAPGEKLVRASEVLEIVEGTKPKPQKSSDPSSGEAAA
jgi:hypothetical protein